MKTNLKVVLVTGMLIICNMSFSQGTETRKVSNFSKIDILGNIRVELYKSDAPSLEITLKDLSSENLITDVSGGTLKIRIKTGSDKNAKAKIKVYYQELERLSVGNAALITSDEVISGESMDFSARSGGKMELELQLEKLEAEVYLGAILVFKGEVEKQEVSVNTGATYSAYQLEASESYVTAGAGGKAKVKASKKIEASASAGGFIGVIGDPEIDITKTSLGGEIAKYKTEEAAGINE